ncbi:MAG: hypothetical protein ACRDID_10250, partial [Ktedonobacterales bacterium]
MASGDSSRETPRSRVESGARYGDFSPRREAFSRAVGLFVEPLLSFLLRHWLAVVNSALIVFIGIAFLAPIGMSLGFTGPSSGVFDVYRYFCG